MAAAVVDSREEELSKLKQMVQQLQHQNAILRNQSLTADSSEVDDFSVCSSVSNNISGRTLAPKAPEPLSSRVQAASAVAPTTGPKTTPSTAKPTKPSAPSLPTPAVLDLPEEECWLFRSPKAENSSLSSKQSSLLWAREVFDSPASQLHRHRHDLLHRLEAILTLSGAAGSSAIKPLLFGGSAPSLADFNLADKNVHPSAAASSSVIPGRREIPKSTLSLSPAPPVTGYRRERGLYASVNTATFTRPRRQHSETNSQKPEGCAQSMNLRASDAAFQPSLYCGGTSPADKSPFKASGSCDDLQNVEDLQVIARMQEDDLKAQVAAMNAGVMGKNGSQQSLASNRSSTGGEPKSGSQSPYSSTTRLFQPARSQRSSPNGRTQMRVPLGLRPRLSNGSNDSMNEVGGVAGDAPLGISLGHDYGRRASPSPPLPMKYSPESPGSTVSGFYSLPHAPPPPVGFAVTPYNGESLNTAGDSQLPRAVIVGRSHRPLHGGSALPTAATRLPMASAKLGGMLIQPRRSQLTNGNAILSQDLKTSSSQETIPQTLPSYAWGDVLPHASQPLQHTGEHLRYSSSEQLDNHAATQLQQQQPYPRPRRIPVPPPRCGSALSSIPSTNQNAPQ